MIVRGAAEAAPRSRRRGQEGGLAESVASEAQASPVIELLNVSKTFGEVRALQGVNFAVKRKEIVGLLGDNGSGKSTLVKPRLRRRFIQCPNR